jgi:hypothetical protein
MANAKVGQRDKQGRYWTGSEWKTLNQVMQAQQKIPGKTGETIKLPGVGEIKYTGDKYGLQTASTVASRQSPVKPKPIPKDSRLDSPIAGKGPKGNEVGSRPAAPAPAAPAPSGGSVDTNRGTPAPTRRPAPASAPQASPVAKYMASAAAARKIQDPVQRAAEMEKVKQTGMQIWAKANPKLAAASAERQRTRGTAQTDNPLMKDMRSRLPVTPTVQAPDFQKTMSAGKFGTQGYQSLTQNPNAAVAATPKPAAKPMEKPKPQTVKSSYEYEPYELVLEYLLSEGHADTVEEAHYVMMQMTAEHIQDIVEGVMPEPIDPTAHKEAQRLARQQGKVRSLEAGATTPGEQKAAQSKLRGPQLPGV